ncbi:MAG: RES family NAD+ phosphorylase [Bythopirellula sp.]|nr:RES family NAD+ phosphorylase [Bythopirellula sp.]
MDVWRICRLKHQASAFTGSGAEKTGGRWNHKGHPMVYTSENLSLAALELFVHVSPGIIPDDLISMRGKLPDSVSTIEIAESDLPSSWRNYPAPDELPTIGTDWLLGAKSLVLIVPSAINALEKNLLLNPAHSEIKRLKIDASQPFQFDPRMFGK